MQVVICRHRLVFRIQSILVQFVVVNWQEFEKEALFKKNIVEKLLESSSLDGDAELVQLTDAWEVVRRMEMNQSSRLQQALQLVSDIFSLLIHWFNMSWLDKFLILLVYIPV